MIATQGLTFLPTTTVLVIGAALVTATAWLSWAAWSRSGYARGTGLLELLRLVVVTLVAVTLCQPEWIESRPPEQAATIAVLVDESGSMQVRDELEAEAESSGLPVSRADAIAPLLSADVWSPPAAETGAELEVVFEPFSSGDASPEPGTDLNGALARVLESNANLRGVVVLSDGDWNVGGSPTLAATRYRLAGVPVFGVGVGSPTPLPDLELVRMEAPTFGVLGKPLRIPFAVRSTLPQDQELVVTLEVDGAPMATDSLLVPAMEEA